MKWRGFKTPFTTQQAAIVILVLTVTGCATKASRGYAPTTNASSEHQAVIRYLDRIEATFLELDGTGNLIGLCSHNKFDDNGMQRLSHCADLEYLSLLDSPVSDAHLKSLHGKRMRRLVLWNSAVTDKGTEIISQIKTLKWLDLSYTRITDKSVRHLCELDGLEHLIIEGTRITPVGMAQLQESLPHAYILYGAGESTSH